RRRSAGVAAGRPGHRRYAPLARRRSLDAGRVAPRRRPDPGGNSSGARPTRGGARMIYAPLDPNDAIFLFADLQEGIRQLAATTELTRLRRAVEAVAKLAALFNSPAIVTTAPAAGGARVTPEIAAALGELPQHVRTTTDAFTHAPTREAIERSGR